MEPGHEGGKPRANGARPVASGARTARDRLKNVGGLPGTRLASGIAMNAIKTLMIATPLAALFGACGYSHMAMDGDRTMHAALDDAEVENQRHADACEFASSMSDMMSELERHDNSMVDLMERMDEARGRMGSGSMGMGGGRCSGPSFEHMSLTLESMYPTMSDHITRMREAGELGAARSECASHTDAMAEMMRSIMDDVESMSCMQ
jgi:hypothetical protein